MSTSLERYYDSLGNVVVRDGNGNPSIFVRHPKQNSSEFDPILPDHAHPAFMKDGVAQDSRLIGKYLSSQVTSGGLLYSLPNADIATSGNNISDVMSFRALASYGNVTAMTIADHGLHVLMAHKAKMPTYGNTNEGQDYRQSARWEGSKAVTAGTSRCFAGWEYLCLKAHTTSLDLRPDKAPGYWQRVKRVGGSVPKAVLDSIAASNSNVRTYTGSGPLNWNFLSDITLESDIIGIQGSFLYGFRIIDGELQIMADNDAGIPATDVTDSSSGWRAIKPHTSDSGYDLVSTGGTDTVHYCFVNGKATMVARELTSGEKAASGKWVSFTTIEVDSTTIPVTPCILYELGLVPIPGTTVDGQIYWDKPAGTKYARTHGSGSRTYSGITTLIIAAISSASIRQAAFEE